MSRFNMFSRITVISAFALAGCAPENGVEDDIQAEVVVKNETGEDSGSKKVWPYEAAAWRWSYPDATWDADQANEVARVMGAWKEKFTAGSSREVGGTWRLEGPRNIGGRLNFLRENPLVPGRLYAGSAGGGLWVREDLGTDWEPRTDGMDQMAMGSIAFHPTDADIVYLGTGDPQISSFPRLGGGVFKSTDGGSTWAYSGCGEARIVSALLVYENEPETVLAATMGNPAVAGANRGVYRTTDGGENWEQTLLPGDSTGVNDLARSEVTGTVLASAWTRQRTSWQSVVNGPDCGLHRSTDGGETWSFVSNPWNTEDAKGRIGLAESEGVFWCLVVNELHQLDQIFRSDDDGLSWTPVIWDDGINDNVLGGFGWYFSKVRVNPWNPDDITLLGVDVWNSLDGGHNWSIMTPIWWTYEVHADKHDLQWTGPQTAILATDGGAYRTTNHGLTWTDIENLPNSQFYRVAVNPHDPGRYTGGAQDNGTCTGSFEDLEGWTRDRGGDGFTAAYHPDNPNLRYATVQWGAFAYSQTGPGDEPLWNDFTWGIEEDEERFWWDAPLMLHPADPDVAWCGSQRVYKMEEAPGGLWQAVSEDLTGGAESEEVSGLRWRSITALGGSPFDADVVAAGTSDGRIWLTEDGGDSWTSIAEGLPDRFVTSIVFDPFAADSMFCTLSGYRDAVYTPHVFRAAVGEPWNAISGDLPEHPANTIEPLNDSTWVLATDVGAFLTRNRGVNWEPIASGNGEGLLPMIPIYDLAIDANTSRLVAGTFARSIHSFPMDSLLTEQPDDVTEIAIEAPVLVAFPVPFVDRLSVESSRRVGNWTVIEAYDALGRLVAAKGPGRSVEFDTADWPNGAYHFRASYADGSLTAITVLK